MTLESISNLGFCCRRAERYVEAIKYFQRGLPGWRKRFAADNMSFVGYLNNLAQALFLGKEFKEAEEILRECIPLLDQKLGKTRDEWKVFRARYWLGASLLGLGEYDEAEDELLAAYEGLKSQENTMSDYAKAYLVDAT